MGGDKIRGTKQPDGGEHGRKRASMTQKIHQAPKGRSTLSLPFPFSLPFLSLLAPTLTLRLSYHFLSNHDAVPVLSHSRYSVTSFTSIDRPLLRTADSLRPRANTPRQGAVISGWV